jgi:copper chaperone CopZ
MGEAAAEDDGNNTIVLQVDMHCEGCKAKVKKAIKKLKGN